MIQMKGIEGEYAGRILYGSRAKGTAGERSDIDIAVSGGADFDELLEKVEELPTLYSVDLLYKDTDGEFMGIDVEIATEALHRMGYEPEFKLIVWENKNKLLEDGELDCIWGCFSMNGREDKYGLIMSLPITIFFFSVTVSVSTPPLLQPESIFTASRMHTSKIFFCTFPFFILPSCILQALPAVLPLINIVTQKYTKTRQQINSCELLVDRSVIPQL